MNRSLRIALAAFSVVACLCSSSCKWESKTHIDPKEEAAKEQQKLDAIAEAKKSLPEFWQKFDANGGTDATYSVKAKITDATGNTENLWIGGLQRVDQTRFRGGLAESPKKLVGKRMADIVEFSVNDVVDWWILKQGGTSEGRFTKDE